MKKILLLIVALTAYLAFGASVASAKESLSVNTDCKNISKIPTRSLKPSQFDCFIDYTVSELNKVSPVKIDKLTTLTSASKEPNKLVFNYVLDIETVLKDYKLPKQEALDKMKVSLKLDACILNGNQTVIINQGISFKQNFYDKDNNLLVSVDLDKKKCIKYINELKNRKQK